ncbi:MAG: cupin domain-containing protein [Methyloceanibacter sp.]
MSAQFRVSDKLAGVYMTRCASFIGTPTPPWACVIDGHCRVITIDPNNQAEIVDFGTGDVWYFPRGHGRSIQGLGPGICNFILVFDHGYFSEFGTFSITDWLVTRRMTCLPGISGGLATPDLTFATNFGVPDSIFARIPKSAAIMPE